MIHQTNLIHRHHNKTTSTPKSHSPKSHKKYKNFINKIMLPIGLMGPIMLTPQILKIYIEKDAGSIAISTRILLTFISTFWIQYGILNKERVIIISSCAGISCYILMIIGAILY